MWTSFAENWPKKPSQTLSPVKVQTQIDTNTVRKTTYCVDFVKKDTFMGTLFAENVPEKPLPVCFFADKVVGNIHHIHHPPFIASVLKKYP